MRNSLSKKGLSLSTAQSISNLCNQRSKDITQSLDEVNNITRKITIDGEVYTETVSKPLPTNVIGLLKEKAKLHATQAFLMENIRAKDELIKGIKQEPFTFSKECPIREQMKHFSPSQPVDEYWGWNQLTPKEYNEFLENEAYASHIGQFIHKGGKLDRLRTELPTIKGLEFFEIEVGKKTPVVITTHHNSEDLLKLHEELAALHRGYEQKVNYFKSKVKNLVTSENARISKINAEQQAEINEQNNIANEAYTKAYMEWSSEFKKASHEFESERQKRIEETVSLKIEVSPLFQDTIDQFLKTLE